MQDPNAQQYTQEPVYVQAQPTTVVTTTKADFGNGEDRDGHDVALLLLIGGFCFPILWLVCFCITRSQSPRNRKLGLISLILFILAVVVSVIGTILIVAINVAVAASRASA